MHQVSPCGITRPDPKPTAHILIAEDDELIQKLLSTLVEHLGHRYVCCRDGRQALELVQSDHFDLLLMDIRMPVMNGMEALRHIRAWEKRGVRRLPVIAVTAHAMPGDREKYLRAGFDGYLPKPLKLKELAAMIEEMLTAAGTGSARGA